MKNSINLRDANFDDLPAILAIHNDAVLNSVAIWTTTTADLDNRSALMQSRQAAGLPFLAAVAGDELLGYGSFGDFRTGDGYNRTVEHSIYVRSDARGQGIGGMLLARLIEEARLRNKHVMIGGIEAGNITSLSLHTRFGFTEAGRLAQAGYKFGRWLDLVFMQKTL